MRRSAAVGAAVGLAYLTIWPLPKARAAYFQAYTDTSSGPCDNYDTDHCPAPREA